MKKLTLLLLSMIALAGSASAQFSGFNFNYNFDWGNWWAPDLRMPDLTIEVERVGASVTGLGSFVGQDYRITVRNNGGATSNQFEIETSHTAWGRPEYLGFFSHSGDLKWRIAVDGMPADSVKVINARIYFLAAGRWAQVHLLVDSPPHEFAPEGTVNESNERNNTASISALR